MPDKFAEFEEPKKRTLPAALLILALMGGFALHQLLKPRQVQLTGVVEAPTTPSEQVGPSVRLNNGLLVSATLQNGGHYVPGDRVFVVETINLTAAPTYQIAGKDSAP